MELKQACSDCGSGLDSDALSCPHCRSLVHAAELEQLSRNAQVATNGGNTALALSTGQGSRFITSGIHSVQKRPGPH